MMISLIDNHRARKLHGLPLETLIHVEHLAIHGAFIMSRAILYHSSPYYAYLSQSTKGLRPGD